MAPSDRSFTDPRELASKAYADSRNLAARTSLYRYQEPAVDFVGWALDHVPWSSQRVVDVGCGPGGYLRRLATHRGLRLLGIDVSRGMLRDLVRDWTCEAPLPSLAVADARAIPLRDGCCDVVLAMHVLHHVPDIALAIGELRRVLGPGGVALVATNHSTAHLAELDELCAASIRALSAQPARLPSRRRFSLDGGDALLGRQFASVERHDLPCVLRVPDVEPVMAFVDSRRSWIEPLLPADIAWEAMRCEIERRLAAILGERGTFDVETRAGVFVCRV
ncbi:MAG TPA: class I SAM-dependent methyltransferase [Kofleriaceae bacterium]|nr:class I SAM-dependent methyltransferase [Kofleriaceae bacterium]